MERDIVIDDMMSPFTSARTKLQSAVPEKKICSNEAAVCSPGEKNRDDEKSELNNSREVTQECECECQIMSVAVRNYE